MSNRPRLCFIVESGTDVRMVEGLAERFALTVVARTIIGGVEVSQPTKAPFPMAVGPAGRTAFARFVRRYLSKTKPAPDVIVVQGYGLAALAANSRARRAGIRCYMLVCSPVEAYYRCRQTNPQAGKRFRRSALVALASLARLNARLGQHYLVLSDHLADVVRGHGTRRPVRVVPVYGVDTDRFRPADTPKRSLKRELGLPEEGSLIFFSSRIAPEKDAETLLAAVKDLVAQGRQLFILHRSGGHRQFQDAADRFGIGDLVVATDARHPHHELPRDYQASDLCVQASWAEGLGFSPLEALACGVPVVAAAVGGLRETIIPNQTGWTYPPGDVEGLTRAIAEVLDSSAEAASRTARGRELVQTRYERRKVFDLLEDTVSS